MEFRAVIKKSDNWWIGWLVDVPGVNGQEKTREQLIESLKICAEDMLKTPYHISREEELVNVEVCPVYMCIPPGHQEGCRQMTARSVSCWKP